MFYILPHLLILRQLQLKDYEYLLNPCPPQRRRGRKEYITLPFLNDLCKTIIGATIKASKTEGIFVFLSLKGKQYLLNLSELCVSAVNYQFGQREESYLLFLKKFLIFPVSLFFKVFFRDKPKRRRIHAVSLACGCRPVIEYMTEV